MRGEKGGRRRDGGGRRRRGLTGGRKGKVYVLGKREGRSQHLQPITLQLAAPGSISLTSGRTLSHRRRWMRGGAERLRCRRVIGTLRGKQGCGVLPHYIPCSKAHYWGLVAWGHRTRENARYARGGRPVGDAQCRGFDVPLHAPMALSRNTRPLAPSKKST